MVCKPCKRPMSSFVQKQYLQKYLEVAEFNPTKEILNKCNDHRSQFVKGYYLINSGLDMHNIHLQYMHQPSNHNNRLF